MFYPCHPKPKPIQDLMVKYHKNKILVDELVQGKTASGQYKEHPEFPLREASWFFQKTIYIYMLYIFRGFSKVQSTNLNLANCQFEQLRTQNCCIPTSCSEIKVRVPAKVLYIYIDPIAWHSGLSTLSMLVGRLRSV